MKLENCAALVSGGASGLGLAAARALAERGVRTVVLDLPQALEAADLDIPGVVSVAGDVTDPAAVQAAVDTAAEFGGLRALVHTAGVGGPVRLIDKTGEPAPLDVFERIVRVNLVGTFNVLRLAAAAMARLEPVDGERGVCVLTSSIAAFDGRIGQVSYSASKGGVVGMTLPAARDLAGKLIRVSTIAPGTFDTPLLGRLRQDVRDGLAQEVPHPKRFGDVREFAALALHIIDNPMLNGETVRLDGALRMSPR